MLPIERTLAENILELINTDPKSISGITRELNQSGYNYHKLVVTGYLKALEDMGQVRERDLPPSKIYYKSTPHKKDIYELIGEKVSELDLSKRNQVLVATYILQRLYHRPIFRTELHRCGFTGEIEATMVNPERTAETRKTLAKAGFKLPRKEPAYETNLNYDYEFQQIILDILIEQFGIRKFIFERTQSKLTTE